jgi:rare lipoprotein A
MTRALGAAAAVLLFLVAGCGHKKKARAPLPVPVPVGSSEVGLASWYGHPYHGRASASGEIYDIEKLTAAHRTLPFGTWVRVSNLDNRKVVDVRINDRGPFVASRVIDLSHAAAQQIGIIGPGTAKVRLTIIEAPVAAATAFFGVQVGAFKDRDNAERIRREMEQRYGAARMQLRQGDPAVWRVIVGSEQTVEAAGALADRLRQETATPAAFVVRVDGDLRSSSL